MPWRSMTREQAWLLPPTLDDLLPDDHPSRFVAAFIDGLTDAEWADLGVNLEGEALGAPAYHPRALLSVWLYGFMTGLRSSRKLEAACRDQIPYLWLTGWQYPDHNTLWRFYQAHRTQLRGLLRQTVRTAIRLDLLDWAVQAVDGTKVAGNASRDQAYDAAGLQRLLERTEQAIADLEAQNEGGDEPSSPHLPPGLRQAQQLHERVLAARKELEDQGRQRVHLTDPDVRLLRSREGYVAGYNAQAMVTPVAAADASGSGLLITAAEVTQEPTDTGQLLPLIAAAQECTERTPKLTLADAGYFSGANLAACAEQGLQVAIPEEQPHPAHPYHKDRFTYDPATDRYQCPQGQYLSFGHIKRRTNQAPVRVYQATPATCRRCPALDCARS
jgi:transposase